MPKAKARHNSPKSVACLRTMHHLHSPLLPLQPNLRAAKTKRWTWRPCYKPSSRRTTSRSRIASRSTCNQMLGLHSSKTKRSWMPRGNWHKGWSASRQRSCANKINGTVSNKKYENTCSRKTTFETEMAEIQEALKDTQSQLDKAMSGVVINVEDAEEKADTDIDMIFTNMDKEKEKQKDPAEEQTEKDNAELLRQTQAGHQLLAKQIGEMQQQMTYMAQILMSPAEGSPLRQTHAMGTSPTPTTPATPTRRRNALEPFARSGSHKNGPYGATPEKTTAPTDASLESLDGYGPVWKILTAYIENGMWQRRHGQQSLVAGAMLWAWVWWGRQHHTAILATTPKSPAYVEVKCQMGYRAPNYNQGMEKFWWGQWKRDFMSKSLAHTVSHLRCGWAGQGRSSHHGDAIYVSQQKMANSFCPLPSFVIAMTPRTTRSSWSLGTSNLKGHHRTIHGTYIAMRTMSGAENATMRRRVPTTRRLTTSTRWGRVGFLQHLTPSSGIMK